MAGTVDDCQLEDFFCVPITLLSAVIKLGKLKSEREISVFSRMCLTYILNEVFDFSSKSSWQKNFNYFIG